MLRSQIACGVFVANCQKPCGSRAVGCGHCMYYRMVAEWSLYGLCTVPVQLPYCRLHQCASLCAPCLIGCLCPLNVQLTVPHSVPPD